MKISRRHVVKKVTGSYFPDFNMNGGSSNSRIMEQLGFSRIANSFRPAALQGRRLRALAQELPGR